MAKKLKPGDFVVMVNEGKTRGKIWKVKSEPCMISNEEVVLLEGKFELVPTKHLYRMNADKGGGAGA